MVQQGDKIENKRTGQRMVFMKTWAETNGTQLQMECFSPVTSAREPLHVHPYQENRFQILSGELRFEIDCTEQKARAGDIISIPKNVPHRFWNPGEVEAHYIQEFYPALKIDGLFETFFALARDRKLNKHGTPNMFRAALIMLKYKNELRLAKPQWIFQKTMFSLLAPVSKLLGYKSEYR